MRATFVSVLLMTTFVVAPVAMAEPNAPSCVTLPSGTLACGYADTPGCGISVGAGVATGSVQWELVSVTQWGQDTFSLRAPVFAGAATAPCATTTCTTAELFADGVLVSQSQTVCFSI